MVKNTIRRFCKFKFRIRLKIIFRERNLFLMLQNYCDFDFVTQINFQHFIAIVISLK